MKEEAAIGPVGPMPGIFVGRLPWGPVWYLPRLLSLHGQLRRKGQAKSKQALPFCGGPHGAQSALIAGNAPKIATQGCYKGRTVGSLRGERTDGLSLKLNYFRIGFGFFCFFLLANGGSGHCIPLLS